jgi:hypothetical protein
MPRKRTRRPRRRSLTRCHAATRARVQPPRGVSAMRCMNGGARHVAHNVIRPLFRRPSPPSPREPSSGIPGVLRGRHRVSVSVPLPPSAPGRVAAPLEWCGRAAGLAMRAGRFGRLRGCGAHSPPGAAGAAGPAPRTPSAPHTRRTRRAPRTARAETIDTPHYIS